MPMELTAILVVSTVVKLIVDQIRKVLPIEGVVVNLVALAVGVAATFIPDVGVFETWIDRVELGAYVAGVSHIFAEATLAMRASKEANEASSGISVEP